MYLGTHGYPALRMHSERRRGGIITRDQDREVTRHQDRGVTRVHLVRVHAHYYRFVDEMVCEAILGGRILGGRSRPACGFRRRVNIPLEP